ncbi:MAG: hypothetical protein ACM3II_13815 [Rhodospirillaceae bacterium]
MRTPAVEDFDTIGARRAEIAAERLAWAQCTCEPVVDAQGHEARSWSPSCPVHKPQALPDCPIVAALAAAGYRVVR